MRKVLFITYDGLLDPLGRSQILPYIIGLSKKGLVFTVLSFEKKHSSYEIDKLKKLLKSFNINWYHLKFNRGKFQGIVRILNGAIYVRKICNSKKIDIVHLRAILPAIIFTFAFIKKKFIYDIRSFAGQWVDTKAIRKGSLLEKIFLLFEKYLIKNASGIVVLDESGGAFLKDYYRTNKPYKVIPTSTDISKYKSIIKKQKEKIKFVFVGGVQYPYLAFEALSFIKQLIDLGYKCSIDFINKGDHKLIKDLAKKIHFPKEMLKVFEMENEEMPDVLIHYDCGLVFIAEGNWLKMCSPTKIGEYLASGLFIISLEGINITDRFSKKYKCFDLVRRDFLKRKITLSEAEEFIYKIKSPEMSKISKDVAFKYYDLNKALENYFDLYNMIR